MCFPFGCHRIVLWQEYQAETAKNGACACAACSQPLVPPNRLINTFRMEAGRDEMRASQADKRGYSVSPL